MRKVVFDTNVYISAFITPGGRAHEAYLLALDGTIMVYTSVPILTEIAIKLHDKFHWDDDKITDAIKHIAAVATMRKPSKRITVLKNEPDNRILECAIESGASIIVTGDKHLLMLEEYEGIEIVTLSKFLKMTD